MLRALVVVAIGRVLEREGGSGLRRGTWVMGKEAAPDGASGAVEEGAGC